MPLVNTAMYEVLAELEQMLMELRKPIDREAIGRKLQESAPGGHWGAEATRFLSRAALIPSLKGETKKEVIEELLDVLDRNRLVRDVKAAGEAIWKREESMSTGMQYGIAIPHGKCQAVSELVMALGITPGIEFDSIDDQPVNIIILLVSASDQTGPHIQALAGISRLMLDDQFKTALEQTTSAEQAYTLLQNKENE